MKLYTLAKNNSGKFKIFVIIFTIFIFVIFLSNLINAFNFIETSVLNKLTNLSINVYAPSIPNYQGFGYGKKCRNITDCNPPGFYREVCWLRTGCDLGYGGLPGTCQKPVYYNGPDAGYCDNTNPRDGYSHTCYKGQCLTKCITDLQCNPKTSPFRNVCWTKRTCDIYSGTCNNDSRPFDQKIDVGNCDAFNPNNSSHICINGSCQNCICKDYSNSCKNDILKECGRMPVVSLNESLCNGSTDVISSKGNFNVSTSNGCAKEIAAKIEYEYCKTYMEYGNTPSEISNPPVEIIVDIASKSSNGITSCNPPNPPKHNQVYDCRIEFFGDYNEILDLIPHEVTHLFFDNDMNVVNQSKAINEGMAISETSDPKAYVGKCERFTHGIDSINGPNVTSIQDILTKQDYPSTDPINDPWGVITRSGTYGQGFLVVDYLLKIGGSNCTSKQKLYKAFTEASKNNTIESWNAALIKYYGINIDQLDINYKKYQNDSAGLYDVKNGNFNGCNWCTCKTN